MSMGKRKREVQGTLWVASDQLQSPGHAFYERLNKVFEKHKFDLHVEALCDRFYSDRDGRPSIPPGVYFRMLLVGYFEGIGSERAIAWRCEDSLSLRSFLGLSPEDRVPDHSSLSRIRQRLDVSVYKSFQKLVLQMLSEEGLLKGRQLALDSTLIRADAAMKAIVRRDTNQSYAKYVKSLAKAAGDKPTRAGAARVDRKRKGRTTSNKDWRSETDEDARIARMKDGRTRLAHKPEHAVDLESGAIVAATMNPADLDDRKTMIDTLVQAEENLNALKQTTAGATLVADKGYHSTDVIAGCVAAELKPCIAEPELRTKRRWTNKDPLAEVGYRRNRRRIRSEHGKRLLRKRGELVERTFEHVCDRGGYRRTRLRGREENEKRYLVQVSAFNLGVLMRKVIGVGTPKGLAALSALLRALIAPLLRLLSRRQPPYSQISIDRSETHHQLTFAQRLLTTPRLRSKPTSSTGC